jgi:4-hydroxyphenylpyruvate dioxygenase
MPDRAALNLATLGPRTLEEKFYAAATAGFAAVGLSASDLDDPEERGREELRLSELSIAELEGIEGWMHSSRTARSLAMVRAEHIFATAAELGAAVVIAWASEDPVEAITAATYFADLCRAAEPFGIRVGLEFLGHSSTVKDLSSAWRIVEMAGMERGGVVIDTFHFHRGGSTPEMADPIPGDKIFLVQMSDVPDLPLRELEDKHRLYPGTGILALEQILGLVRAKGYTGHYSLELHNEDYWQEEAVVVASEGLRSMRRLDIA